LITYTKDEVSQTFVRRDNEQISEAENAPKSGGLKTFGAASALFNPVTSAVVSDSTLSVFDKTDPNYNPEDEITEQYAPYKDVLVKAKDSLHMERLKSDIRRKEKYENVMANSGGKGIAIGLAAGVLDPIGLIPVLGQVKRGATAVKSGKIARAGQVAKSGATVGATGAVSAAASEIALQATQPALSGTESAFGVAAGAVLGGILGSSVKSLDIKRFDNMAKNVENDFRAMSNPPARAADLDAKNQVNAINSSVGAKQADEIFTSKDLQVVANAGVSKATAFMSPIRRILHRESDVAKQVVLKAFETPVKVNAVYNGKAMPVSAETFNKQYDVLEARSVEVIKNGYKPVKEKLGIKPLEYRERVAKALRRNDTDEFGDENISNVAKQLRKELFDPLKKEAINVGLLPEDIEAKFADSYLYRVPSKKKIEENVNGFIEKIMPWAERKTRQIIDSVSSAYNRKITALDGQNSRLEDQAGKLNDRLYKIESGVTEKFDYRNLSTVQDDYLEKLKRDIGLQEIGSYLARYELEDVAQMVNGAMQKRPSMPSGIASEIVKRGGISGERGDLKAMGITNRSRVGLFNKNGKSLDVIARELVDEGFTDLDIDDLDVVRDAIREDIFGSGYYRASDSSLVAEADMIDAGIEDSLRALERAGVKDYKSFYKNIYEDIKLSKRDLRKASKDERIRIKAARQGAREAQKATKPIREELARLRNAEKARISRELKKIDAKKKSNIQKMGSIEADKRMELDRFNDAYGEADIEQYARQVAEEMKSKILDPNLDQSILSEIVPEKRGPLRGKTWDIEDLEIEEFLENDINVVANAYRHQMGTQIELHRAFGNTDLKEQLGEIAADYEAKIKNAKPKEAKKLQKEMKKTIRDIEGMRDVMYGVYDKSDPDSAFRVSSTVLRDVQFLAKMGMVSVASVPDVARHVMVNGMDNLTDALPMKQVGNLLKKANVEELKEAGFLLEVVLNNRLQTFSDISNPVARGNSVTRFTGKSSQLFSNYTLINHWNDIQKSTSAMRTQMRLLKNINSTDKGEIAFMREFGIDKFTQRTISEQLAKHGDVEENLSGITKWDVEKPAVNIAARKYKAALRKASDISIVTRSVGDTPLYANTALGSLLFQFKSFIMASHNRVLIRSLQARGGKEVAGVALGSLYMVSLGMAVAAVRSELYMRSVEARGRKTSFDPSKWNKRKWILEGVDRSGLVAMMLEPLNILDKATGIGPSLLTGQGQSSRFASRNALGSLMGPSAGTIQDLFQVSRMTASPLTGSDVSESDIYALRRNIPFQNAAIFQQVFDLLEGKANESIAKK